MNKEHDGAKASGVMCGRKRKSPTMMFERIFEGFLPFERTMYEYEDKI